MPKEQKQQTERMLNKISKLTPEQREKVLIFMYGVEAGAEGGVNREIHQKGG